MIGPYRVGDAAQVVLVADAKAYLRIDHTDEDTLITALVAAATEAVAQMTGQVLGEEVWAFKVPAPTSGDLVLPVFPVRSVNEITYLDRDGAPQDADPADFLLFSMLPEPALRPDVGKSWPSAAVRPDAVTVEVTAGMTELPPALKVAILMMTGHFYQNRSAVDEGQKIEAPLAVSMLVEPYRVKWVAA